MRTGNLGQRIMHDRRGIFLQLLFPDPLTGPASVDYQTMRRASILTVGERS